jgi:hypothetical protein
MDETGLKKNAQRTELTEMDVCQWQIAADNRRLYSLVGSWQ